MDLTHQIKLSKAEWESIEIPVSEDEHKILQVILDGYNDINIRYNENSSLLQILKIKETTEFHSYFYYEYFEMKINEMANANVSSQKKTKSNEITKPLNSQQEKVKVIHKIIEDWKKEKSPKKTNINKIKKADLIRIQHMSKTIENQKQIIFEFIILDFCEKMIQLLVKNDGMYGFYLYTLGQLLKSTIPYINIYVISFLEIIMDFVSKQTNITEIFHYSPKFIEKNQYLLKYEDITLFTHQKQLFSIFKNSPPEIPKLILYMAPTGTGKTMSPIGLSANYKIIFVCVARHVGLALAKSAISMGKKVAFAFGCETASDIRLHYFAAINYTVDKKSGGIRKVDNSNGNNVEIIICDVKSYLTAMHYMLAFHQEKNIITYWDEPTITMDYIDHPLHEIIHRNWVENRISKLVLSCATLPKEHEIIDTVTDFRSKFENTEIHTIASYDCKKSISILNKDIKCALPHLLFTEYDLMLKSVKHCNENKTLLRYLDLEEIVRYVEFINSSGLIREPYTLISYFNNIHDITMTSIKEYYLETLNRILPEHWVTINEYLVNTQKCKFVNSDTSSTEPFRKIKSVEIPSTKVDTIVRMNSVCLPNIQQPPQVITNPFSGILLTTVDAHTLTDGPTIFLVEDVKKIGNFYIQQSKIPEKVFEEIMSKIQDNEVIQKKIYSLEHFIEDALGKDKDKEKKMEKETFDKDTKKLMNELEELHTQIKMVTMNPKYIPNMRQHQMLWVPDGKIIENAFVPFIDEPIVKEIMSIDVENYMKVLLLLGIGMFVTEINNELMNARYIEIMKKLAMEQKLFIIIAQSDYIYGTNYQFCHGFIGKDLTNMTQQKTIQAMGRIGRSKIQQDYTLRFRDDVIIKELFLPAKENTEAINMSRLFCD